METSPARPDPTKSASRYLMTQKGYLHPMKTYVWITLLILGVLTLLYFVLGLSPDAQGSIPPAFAFGASDLYFHAIAIGLAALAVYLVVMAFDLDRYEPAIDFPLSYRALAATVLGAVGAVFYLRPVFNQYLAPLPLGLVLVGLLLLADVGGALLVQLYLLPGKLSGTYDPRQNRLGMIPRWRTLPTWKDFRRMDSTYWLTFTTVISAFIAGVTGFVVFWVNYFVIDIGVSPALFSGYIDWLGGAQSMLGATMGSHSHVIVMALMVGAVAIVARQFRVLSLDGWSRRVAQLGLWTSVTGIVVMTGVFVLEAYTTVFPNGSPGVVLASDPGGAVSIWAQSAANGMMADDTTMLWAALGALILFVPLLRTKVAGHATWRDPLRASILGTWVLAFVATPLEGFYIEFHESTLAGNPPDVIFGNLQYFALIGITLVSMSLVAMDFCPGRLFCEERTSRRTAVAVFSIVATSIATVGATIYTFVTNDTGSVGYWVFNVGLVLMGISLLGAMATIYGSPHARPDDRAAKGTAARDAEPRATSGVAAKNVSP